MTRPPPRLGSSNPAAGSGTLAANPERVLLINPSINDTRFPWARWTQPTLLLRLVTHLSATGADLKLLDALEVAPGERLRRELANRIELEGVKVNRWRFGQPHSAMRARLKAHAQAGWVPDQVYVEGLTTFWWEGVEEAVQLARKVFPRSEVVLLGTYPTLAPEHARRIGADVILSTPVDELEGLPASLAAYERSPGFSHLWLGGHRSPAEIVEEVAAKAAKRQVRHFAFADPWLAADAAGAARFRAVLEGLAARSLKIRLYVLGNLAPAHLVAYPDLAGLMKRAGYAEVHFSDDRGAPLSDAAEQVLLEDYRRAAELLASAGFEAREGSTTGALCVGRLGEDLGRRARLATRMAHEVGSLIVWPYQPSPEECPDDVPLEDQNGKLFPLRERNGLRYRDYLDVLGLAALMSSKYRQRTFDFLGEGRIASLFRRSLADRAWEPAAEVKGQLGVAPRRVETPGTGAGPWLTVISQGAGRKPAQLVTDQQFPIPTGKPGFKRALLLNPPVYDAQYWARWSQPAGLLRIGSYLKRCGYTVDLLDCMETDEKGYVAKRRKLVDGRPQALTRDDVTKPIYHFGLPWEDVDARLRALPPPDQVWITSIMTYWWESTRDAVEHVRRVFPDAEIIVGGIYPTLAPQHAVEHLGADVVFMGELSAASELPTDLNLYHERTPSYAILTTSRGCPWDCNYCSARTLNAGTAKMRARDPEEVLAEIEDKHKRLGIRRFGFYEDNALALRGHLQRVLEMIIERGLKLELYAPEGFETRLLTVDLLRTMKQAGFEKVHLPFEALRWETNLGWNRRHASTASFEQALDAAIQAGFKPRTEEINAFVLFGLPDDALEHIVDSVAYVHHTLGSIIPMLFTPVPGTHVFREHERYLLQEPHDGRQWDLQDLNGKFLPFLEYNRARYPGLRASDYLQLEGLMSILNSGKVLSQSVDLCAPGAVSAAFRSAAEAVVEKAQRSPAA